MMRIGILGGTFDPIHHGHTGPAEQVKQSLDLDQIWLMPNHIPPHKESTHVTSAQRLAMVELVCQQHKGFHLCDIEAQRSTPSYTSDTLAELKALYPNSELFFIMGMDSFNQLHLWHQWQNIFNFAHIIVCQRPGWSQTPNGSIQPALTWHRAQTQTNRDATIGNIHFVDITQVDCSSTQIRTQLATQGHADGLDKAVLRYIHENQLYQGQ